MRTPDRPYRCVVCQWQGQLEPIDVDDAAPCPQCGVYLYPLSWMQTWGIVLVIIATTVAAVFAAVKFMR